MNGIHVEELSRSFAVRGQLTRYALDRVDLRVMPGQVHGLLGPNGAGKTTLARILTTLLAPSSGNARVAGYDVVSQIGHVKRHVGVSFGGDTGLYTQLTARNNLLFFATMYGLPRRHARQRAERLLATVGLDERADDRVERFSRGMRQRLHIARALIHDPQVVILDEPSGGLDATAAQDLRLLVRKLAREGRTVLLATHNLAEVEAVADRISILREGRVITDTTPDGLRQRLVSRMGSQVVVTLSDPVSERHWAGLPGRLSQGPRADQVTVTTDDPAAVFAFLVDRMGPSLRTLSVLEPGLEDAYIAELAHPS
jgi:ABC-2 type transport system ATP-binding protein